MIGLSEYDPLFDDVEYPVESILTTDVSLFQSWPLSPCHATRPTPTFHGRRKLRNPINNRRLTVANCLPRVSGCTMGEVPLACPTCVESSTGKIDSSATGFPSSVLSFVKMGLLLNKNLQQRETLNRFSIRGWLKWRRKNR